MMRLKHEPFQFDNLIMGMWYSAEQNLTQCPVLGEG